MKTSISIQESLLREAGETARAMGLTRSRLFAVAVREFIRRRRPGAMSEQPNEVYEGAVAPAERRLLSEMKKTVSRTVRDRW